MRALDRKAPWTDSLAVEYCVASVNSGVSLGLGDLSVCPLLRSSSLVLMADPHGKASDLGGAGRGGSEEEQPLLYTRQSGSTATSATLPVFHSGCTAVL